LDFLKRPIVDPDSRGRLEGAATASYGTWAEVHHVSEIVRVVRVLQSQLLNFVELEIG